jgi:alpha-L-fucosidase
MKSKIISGILAGLLLAGVQLVSPAAPAAAQETPAQHNARMAWWRQAKFGMFIHWGVYSVPAGEWDGKTDYAEWIMESAHIPASRYEQFAKEFDPVKFDAKAWVKTAKDAGMKYLVITSKHHDGFCLWPTKLTDWSICRTPWWQRTHRDPLQELSDECRRQGIKFCLYYSIMDWHSSDWGRRRPWNDVATGEPDMDRYVTYMKGQLKELVTRYHPAVLWFDGEWESPWTPERGEDLWNYLRALDPHLIINNRIGKARAGMEGMDQGNEHIGDFGTPEQQIPPAGFGPGVDWETCMTMNNHWGYNQNDQHWKSPATIIRNLCDIASKGGNYLLNVGPTSEGVIPQPCVERLGEVGQWMKVNGAAIYGSGPTPFGAEAGGFSATEKDKNGKPKFIPSWDWRATTRPGKIYLEIFKWPADGQIELPGLRSEVKHAELLATRQRLKTAANAAGVNVQLPADAPDKIASVVCVEINGKTAKVAPAK